MIESVCGFVRARECVREQEREGGGGRKGRREVGRDGGKERGGRDGGR